MKSVEWTIVPGQSLALAAREAGYDLAMFEHYPDAVQSCLRSRAIKYVLRNLCDEYEEVSGKPLSEVKYGVYVICLSEPFTIQYEKAASNVIYIGRGVIANRLKSHFERSLFTVMMSLAGADFDFYLAEPRDINEQGYFKQLEHDLLANFKGRIGGVAYPLLNKYAGSDQGLKLGTDWNYPIKSQGKRPTWAIKLTGKRPIRELD